MAAVSGFGSQAEMNILKNVEEKHFLANLKDFRPKYVESTINMTNPLRLSTYF